LTSTREGLRRIGCFRELCNSETADQVWRAS